MIRRRAVGRAVVRTAAVGGAAYVAGSHMATKSAEEQQREAAQNAQIADLQQQQAAMQQPTVTSPQPVYAQPPAVYAQPPEQMSAATPARDPMESLKQLGELKAAGVITDEEFEVKKAQLLKQI